jgi:hypothetical protein
MDESEIRGRIAQLAATIEGINQLPDPDWLELDQETRDRCIAEAAVLGTYLSQCLGAGRISGPALENLEASIKALSHLLALLRKLGVT